MLLVILLFNGFAPEVLVTGISKISFLSDNLWILFLTATIWLAFLLYSIQDRTIKLFEGYFHKLKLFDRNESPQSKRLEKVHEAIQEYKQAREEWSTQRKKKSKGYKKQENLKFTC